MHQDQIKQNLLSSATWLRILFMTGFAVAVWLTLVVLVVVVLAQVVIVLGTGRPNPNLQRFGLVAGAYLFELVQFLLYNTDDKPFPCAPFPEPPELGADDDEDDDEDEDDDDGANWGSAPDVGTTAVQPPSPGDSDPESSQDRPLV